MVVRFFIVLRLLARALRHCSRRPPVRDLVARHDFAAFHAVHAVLAPLLRPMGVVNVARNFAFEVKGEDRLVVQFTDIVGAILTFQWKPGFPRSKISPTRRAGGPLCHLC